MRLGLKLLTPTLLAALLAVSGIVSLSIFDRRIAAQSISERVTRTRAAFADGIQDRQREAGNAADLLAHSWRFIDDVAINQLDHLADTIEPLHGDLAIGFLAVYDREGRVVVRGDRPELFGKTDNLLPLVRASIAGNATQSTLAIHEGRIFVLAFRQLTSGTTNLGAVAVGKELDQDYADNFSADHLVHIVFSANGQQVLASRGWKADQDAGGNWEADHLRIPLLIDSRLEVTCWRNTTAELVASRQHLLVILILAIGSAGLIGLSHRLVTKTVISLDAARRAAQAAEKRVAEIEARRNDAFLQGMIADSPIACVVIDGHAGKVLYANRCFTQMWSIGVTLGELCGAVSIDRLSQLCAPRAANPQDFALSLAELADPEERRVVEDEVVLGDGRITKRFSAPIRDSEDRPLGRVFLFEDITARKNYERDLIRAKNTAESALAQAEAASRAKGEFLSVMSHELRTPLNGVIGLGHVLAQSKLDQQQRECVSTMVECGHHLLTVISDILDFSKLDAGKMTTESVAYRPRELMEAVAALVKNQADAKNLNLVVEIDPQIPEQLTGDPQRIRQILLNLLSNALKFTERGEIALRGQLRGNRVHFSVADTGIGISHEAQARLFTPFTQADSSTSRKYGGTGLGLAISRRLAELMDGRIELASRLGAGSVFTLDLPLTFPSAPASAPHAIQAPSPNLLRGLRILVVEDDAVNRMVAARLLPELGCVVEVVESGQRALAIQASKADDDLIDVVLMDLQMPELDGYACTAKWRAEEERNCWRRVPILALSAAVSDDDIASALAAGMNGHIAKPIDSAELVRKLMPWAIAAGRIPH